MYGFKYPDMGQRLDKWSEFRSNQKKTFTVPCCDKRTSLPYNSCHYPVVSNCFAQVFWSEQIFCKLSFQSISAISQRSVLYNTRYQFYLSIPYLDLCQICIDLCQISYILNNVLQNYQKLQLTLIITNTIKTVRQSSIP